LELGPPRRRPNASAVSTMARFEAESEFRSGLEDALHLLPINFERLDDGRVLVTNLVGDHALISSDQLERLIGLDFGGDEELLSLAHARNLIARRDARGRNQLIAARLRSRMSFLKEPTALHIFVVSLRCEHSCPYCQVSRRSESKAEFDMSWETSSKSLDIAFQSPSQTIKIEFQGGEPLLNFPLIKRIVREAELRRQKNARCVEYVIATNLALLTDEILDFCKEYAVNISTSLDGPADLHNHNRPRPGHNSHQLAVEGIKRVKEALGADRVSALMTTTEASLDRPCDIVDEYLAHDLDGIFLRPLSPYGFAVKTKWIDSYNPDKWLSFYERGLRYVIEINKRGKHFPEYFAALLVQRIFSDRPIGYVDLRSPAGIGLGAIVYNYDGSVFASDEGRMLAEMGDRTFELGHVSRDEYRSLMRSENLVYAIGASLTQVAPMCSTCAFEPYCGADPVYHHATQGDFQGVKPTSSFCHRQKGIFGLLFRLMDESPENVRVLKSWMR
jgi:uncharacterized protein